MAVPFTKIVTHRSVVFPAPGSRATRGPVLAVRTVRMTRHCLWALVALAVLAINPRGWAQEQSSPAQKFAESILRMFDAGECSKIYDAFDESSRTRTRDQWTKECSAQRKKRGFVVARLSPSETKAKGIHRFIFDTRGTEGKVFEDVGVVRKETEWRLVAFSVTPNLK